MICIYMYRERDTYILNTMYVCKLPCLPPEIAGSAKYMCVCMCIYIYIHTYIHVYIYMCIYIYI